MTPEGKVKQDVKELLHDLGIWFFMPVQTGYGVGGIPDFVCCWRGLFIAIECKAPGKEVRTTPLQNRTISEIRMHGGRAVVVSSAAALKAWLGLMEHLTDDECLTMSIAERKEHA
jgi:hypothetical protein